MDGSMINALNGEHMKDWRNRLAAMIQDDGDTWDLSPNDRKAIAEALTHIGALEAKAARPAVVDATGAEIELFMVAPGHIAVSRLGILLIHFDSTGAALNMAAKLTAVAEGAQ